MVLWVKSPRVASSDCASNPMPILIRLKAPSGPLKALQGLGVGDRLVAWGCPKATSTYAPI